MDQIPPLCSKEFSALERNPGLAQVWQRRFPESIDLPPYPGAQGLLPAANSAKDTRLILFSQHLGSKAGSSPSVAQDSSLLYLHGKGMGLM